MTTSTFERSSSFVETGASDATSQERLAQEAERDHHDRLAAVRVVAGLVADAAEAREIYAMLGLSDTELHEARTVRFAGDSRKISAA